ncbi:FAD-binding oxidoreductase [Aurantimonas sp. Leaf443]|uniref:NAD(P)/FAD-dependent oxidoreductase n=1 Tax=Aurantimonas sp. Leaf443 TaxID=1736378 RepID=UPI0006F34884|nr:FAD-binding oxidoreductase [Aurantimonas sp. Leaf443]KQT85292.1 FAD-dependent oxidoreductase [Aurantimonas sp. Leaf443]
MLNDPRSHGLWEASAPATPETPRLRGEVSADVCIVGAGYTGLSAALHLAERGARAVVLEAAEIGFGGSGRNVGLVNAGLWLRPADVSGVLGPVYGPRLLKLLGEGPADVFDLVERHAIACEPVRAGTLHAALGGKGLADIAVRAEQWQALGAPVELLDAAAAAERIGTAAYAGALLDRRAGTIQPLAYARGLARAAMAAGAAVHTESPVRRAVDEGKRWRVETPDGAVTARHVVVATNAYAPSADAPFPQVAGELVRLPYFNLATRPLSANLARSILPAREGLWDTREVLSSLRFDAAGRLVFGSVGALRGPGRSVHAGWGRRALAKLFPQLGEVSFEHEWYGWIGMTRDAVPRFHRLARDVVSCSGYNGRGIAPGTVFGREIARLLSGEIGEAEMPLPVCAVEPVRFRPAREAWYEAGAQLVHATAARL